MDNIWVKNEIQDSSTDTVRLIFSVTFSDGTSISDGSVTINRADWLVKNGAEKIVMIAQQVSKNMEKLVK